MKKIRLRTLVTFLCAGAAGTVLFYTSQSVQQAEHDLRRIQAAARGEEESIRVLKAEWAYLNSPERIEELSSEYLRLAPAEPEQVLKPSDLPGAELPPEQDAMIHQISQQEPAAGGGEQVPVPSRKPAVPVSSGQDFNKLLKKVGGQGGQ